MSRIEVIKQSDLSDSDLKTIIELKQCAWDYDFEKQEAWINDNLSADDFHVVMFQDADAIAYLNLININIDINDCTYSALGIGNVCSKVKGKGHGKLLMSLVNQYIETKNCIGVLLCKHPLVSFYEKVNWRLINQVEISSKINMNDINMMFYNLDLDIDRIKYQGRNF